MFSVETYFVLLDFVKWRRTDRRWTTYVKTIITTDRYCGAAEWIKNGCSLSQLETLDKNLDDKEMPAVLNHTNSVLSFFSATLPIIFIVNSLVFLDDTELYRHILLLIYFWIEMINMRNNKQDEQGCVA